MYRNTPSDIRCCRSIRTYFANFCSPIRCWGFPAFVDCWGQPRPFTNTLFVRMVHCMTRVLPPNSLASRMANDQLVCLHKHISSCSSARCQCRKLRNNLSSWQTLLPVNEHPDAPTAEKESWLWFKLPQEKGGHVTWHCLLCHVGPDGVVCGGRLMEDAASFKLFNFRRHSRTELHREAVS